MSFPPWKEERKQVLFGSLIVETADKSKYNFSFYKFSIGMT